MYTCGSLLRKSSGNITSPNKLPDYTYESNQRCRWTLVAQEQKAIRLTVEEMDIEEHEDCSSDYLAVRLLVDDLVFPSLSHLKMARVMKSTAQAMTSIYKGNQDIIPEHHPRNKTFRLKYTTKTRGKVITTL